MMTWVRTRFPSIKIYLTESNYSSLLPHAEHSKLNRQTKYVTEYKGVNTVPKLDEKAFQTSFNSIQNNEWSDAMLCLCLSCLN